MPYLLLDDAADEATRRLHQFGQDQLSTLQSAPAGLVQGAQSATASAQDITQRLMQFGQDQLGSLQQQAQPIVSNVDDITGRLHAFGQDQLNAVTQVPQAVQSLLTPMAQQAQAAGAQALQPLQPLVDVAQAGNVNLDQGQGQADQQLQTGGDLKDYARQAALKFGIDPDIFVRQIQQESGFNPNAKSPAGATGIAQFMPGTAAGVGLDPTDPYASLAAAAKMDADNLKKYAGDWAKTLAAYNAGPGNVDKYGGVPPFEETQRYVSTILQGAKDVVQQGVQAAQDLGTKASNVLPQLSQFGDKQLTNAEAYAACGPAAAVRFAEMFGRNPTLREAVDLAKGVGWTAANGMAGLASESKLFDAMGIAHRTVGADWQALAKEAQSGNPVAISTPGHYFTADGYDPNTGAFHVGRSGTDLRQGSEWMTPAQMESVMGPLQGGLAADHPLVPGSSPLSAGTAGGATEAANRLIDVAGQAKDRAMQMLDRGLPLAGDLATGGLTRRFNENLQDLTQKVLGAGQQDVNQPTAELTGGGTVDSQQTLDQLANKYGTRDVAQYNPQDQQLAGQAMLAAGGDLAAARSSGISAPSLDDIGQAKDSALDALERFRQQQAAGDTRDLGWTAPITAEIRRQMTPRPDEELPDWARPKPLDLTKPLGPQLGIDPYGDIVQKGIPQIISGVQQGNLGDVLGGGLQTLMGAASVLPGGGAESAAGRGAREVLPALEQGVLGDLGKTGEQAAEDLLRGEGGAIPVRAGLTLGGAVAGGYAGNATAPEDAELRDRAARIIAGAGAGAGLASGVAGLSRPLEQSVLQSLRTAGVVAGPARATPLRGPIAEAVDLTKQSILTNPATHIANVIGNTIELGRQPIALAMGGRGDDALAGLISVARAVPDAAGNALSALQGRSLATLAGGASNIPARAPVFRALSAADAFTRTLGEYQGMASEANRLLRQAGIAPSDPGAAAYLATHAADLYAQGARAGAQSVFGRVASAGGGRSVLDNIFQTYANAKEGLLNSPRLRDQAMGALMDFFVPFSGVPVQMLEIGMNRLPVAAQASGAVRAVRALAAGNVGEAQRAVGETGLETALQLMIAKQVADGNIRGPDDPEHPNSVRIAGNWVSMNEWGAYSLPMQIMASFADGYEKGGQDIPAGADVAGYYGPRFAGALNASLKPFQQGIPGENLLRLVSNIGQGGTTAGALGLAQDAINRVTVPGAARFVENLIDPVAREVDRKGIASLWQLPMSSWPGLADKLPVKIDPTTGEALQKARTGAGILVGVQQDVASPITREADRLNKAGYNLTPPKAYPDTVSYQGAQVKLSPAEQRAVAQATGHILGNFAQRLSEPDYQQSDEGRKARLMQAYLNAASDARLKAWIDLVGPDVARQRLLAGQTTVGRLNQQATPPAIVPPFLSSSSLSAQEQAAALSGAGR